MMKLCGHTMGTPDKDIFAALQFFADLGLEGVEIRCAANGHLDLETAPPSLLKEVRSAAVEAGVALVCLTPYLRDFSTPEATAQTLAGYRQACRAAQAMGCPLLRAIGGLLPASSSDLAEIWRATAEGLREAARLAADHGVRLVLENHSGTLTQTAHDTCAMVDEVDHPALGILLDHYWVVAAGEEEPLAAVRRQAPRVWHCHCKNLVWVEGRPQASFLDEGVIDWAAVLGVLHTAGYEGYLSDEYEKFWRPELPEPEEGMARNAAYLRRLLAELP